LLMQPQSWGFMPALELLELRFWVIMIR